MLELGAILVGALVAMVALIINSVRIDNEILKKKEAWKTVDKWNWD